MDPIVISAEAVLASAEKKYARALRLFESAEKAGLADSRMLDWKDDLLFAMGRYQQAAALSEHLLSLDPKNQEPMGALGAALLEMHQPQAAMRAASLASDNIAREQFQELVRAMLGGDTAAFDTLFKAQAAAPLDSVDHIDAFLAPTVINALQNLGRYREAREVIDKANVVSVRVGSLDWPAGRIGRFPVADLRGWMDLLLGDASEARRDAEGILKFLKQEPETKWNKWFRTGLLADAQLLTGNAEQAITTADGAVTLTQADEDVSDQMNAVVWATQIRAWAGAQEQAVARLETLSTSVPGLFPGDIVLDPIWSVPLARNDHYLRLCARLDAQMKTVKF